MAARTAKPKCANCNNEAAYYVNEPVANPVYYCTAHLPSHLTGRATRGEFNIPKQTDVQPSE